MVVIHALYSIRVSNEKLILANNLFDTSFMSEKDKRNKDSCFISGGSLTERRRSKLNKL